MIAVLFDLDGTLIDSLPNVRDAANEVLRAYGEPSLPDKIVAGFVGLGEQVFIDRLIAATNLDSAVRADILDRFIVEYKRVAEETRCFPGVAEALIELKGWGVPMGVVTNKPRAPLIPTLQAASLSNFFESIVAGDDLPVRKPDPAPLRHVMNELGADRCVYIGDTPIDAETAERAGVPFGLFTEGIRTIPIEEITFSFSFDKFVDLPGVLRQTYGV